MRRTSELVVAQIVGTFLCSMRSLLRLKKTKTTGTSRGVWEIQSMLVCRWYCCWCSLVHHHHLPLLSPRPCPSINDQDRSPPAVREDPNMAAQRGMNLLLLGKLSSTLSWSLSPLSSPCLPPSSAGLVHSSSDTLSNWFHLSRCWSGMKVCKAWPHDSHTLCAHIVFLLFLVQLIWLV